MKTYNALSKSFTDEVKTIMGGGKSIDEAFEDVKSAIIDNNFDEPTPTPKPIDVNKLTQGDGQQDGYYYVDLGLSVKWATCNVGATLASDEGKLFQFGRVDGYRYNDSSNQFTNNQSSTSGKRYGIGATLDLEDDAAHVNMGGKWRMPIETELEELLNNTTHNTVIVNRVKGMLFTSTKPGYEDKQLFIPFMQGDWYNGNWEYLHESIANMWTSKAHPFLEGNAYNLECISYGSVTSSISGRSYAFSVRGVFNE